MATKGTWNQANIRKTNPVFSPFRVTIETPFYANNIYPVSNVKEAYEMAKDSPGTIVTSLKVKDPERIGLDNNAHVLLFNDGAVYGRCAAARRIYGQPGIEVAEFSSILREAVYKTRYRQLYQAEAVIGLDPDFMVRARLCVPEEHENILYNWMLNFQPINEKYYQMYQQSHVLEKEGDILVFSDPDWSDPRFPLGLSFFDPKTNCAAILGMRYFGEFKKGTLTLAWNIANKNGYVSCHGGLKKYDLKEKGAYVIAFFGLSGSGKSTLTHAKHGGKYDISILHDDAFVISKSNGSSIALEPTYFDKTADYPSDFPDNAFLLTVQNNGATLNEKDEIVLVPEDMRNGNGRAIKSRYWAPNRVDKMNEPIQTIVWLMQDPTIPPLLKITDPVTASAFGATLATKRTSAERLAEGVDPNAL
ncbi:MAG: phosphoenolpyruvate carboxykinase (ATP), partial [Thermotogota bacterium]|nr:phosphoenolpyruvate carboxykinase (ATP) [Thermotogota bacterium]